MNLSYIYIITNLNRTVLYIGITSDIVGRIWEHKNKIYENSFSDKYNLHILVYYEIFELIDNAIDREKQLKGWSRKRKEDLIKSVNPELENLYTDTFIEEFSQ